LSIRRFEDIHARQEARLLVKKICSPASEGAFVKDFHLRDQICGVAISVMANIVAGFDCDSNTEFTRFLGIARRSAVEVQSLLYTAMDVGNITPEQLKANCEQAGKIKMFISAFKSAMPKEY